MNSSAGESAQLNCPGASIVPLCQSEIHNKQCDLFIVGGGGPSKSDSGRDRKEQLDKPDYRRHPALDA